MTTTTAPATTSAIDFYTRALPRAEALLALARAWRDVAPYDPEAIEAHAACFRFAVHVDLRLSRAHRACRPHTE